MREHGHISVHFPDPMLLMNQIEEMWSLDQEQEHHKKQHHLGTGRSRMKGCLLYVCYFVTLKKLLELTKQCVNICSFYFLNYFFSYT